MFKIGDEVEVISLCAYRGMQFHIKRFDGIYYYPDEWKKVGFQADELKLLTPKPFTKEDLRNGDVCITRDGCRYQVVWNKFLIDKERGFNLLRLYQNDLIMGKDEYEDFSEYDIMQVIRNDKVVFERGEVDYHKWLMKFENCFMKYRERLRNNKEYRNEQLAKESLEEALNLSRDYQLLIDKQNPSRESFSKKGTLTQRCHFCKTENIIDDLKVYLKNSENEELEITIKEVTSCTK